MKLTLKDIDAFTQLFSDWNRLESMDNRELTWVLLSLFSGIDEVLGRKALVIDEVAKRLFPEWDGENILFTNTGWKTPEGDINYITAPAGAVIASLWWQLAVQEAIEARGWKWSLAKIGNEWQARVRHVTFTNRLPFISEESAAHALLAAYVAALEATAPVGAQTEEE